MGQAVYFSFSSKTPRQVSRLVARLQQLIFATPVAIGARSGRDYFLAGYALESFASHYLDAANAEPPIDIAFEAEHPVERDYLRSMATRMKQRREMRDEVSPFEAIDARAGFTYVSCPPLSPDTVDRLEAWADVHQMLAVHLECAIELSVATRAVDWTQAFRQLRPAEVGTPAGRAYRVVTIIASTSRHHPDRTRVSMNSGSHAWLRQGELVKAGRITRDDADANLARLALLAAVLASDDPDAISEVSLKVDGTTFIRESERFYAGFSGAMPNLVIPEDLTW